jgi:hypothetical protein
MNLVDTPQKTLNGYECNTLFLNRGAEGFIDAGYLSGTDLLADGRGLGVFDLDNDGDLDLVVQNHEAMTSLLVNQGTGGRHWIQFRLQGTTSNRDAIGAKLRIHHGGRVQTREVVCGAGYLSGTSTLVHFGLGDQDAVERVEITWPSGTREVIERPAANRRHLIIEPPPPQVTAR